MHPLPPSRGHRRLASLLLLTASLASACDDDSSHGGNVDGSWMPPPTGQPAGGTSGGAPAPTSTTGFTPALDAGSTGAVDPTMPVEDTPDAAVDAGPGAFDAASHDASTPPPTDAGGGTTSAEALAELEAHLALPVDARPALSEQPFASVPLTREDADRASSLLWDDRAAQIRSARQAEHDARRLEHEGFVLRYETVVLGSEPAGGRSLFVSMHGGGSAPAATNDQQWRNQVQLGEGYAPEDALWVAPRAPTDDWNMWFKDHIDVLFDRLITNMIVFEGVDPNRVYLNGYSAGGDGVYGLAPRTADRWAGAGMSAGHPNGVSVANMRNVAFALHVGGNDRSFDRHLVTQEYIEKLASLQAADPEGYVHQGMVHAGLPHWMNLADGVSIPFMQAHTRDPAPSRVVWEQHEVVHTRSYWLALEDGDAQKGDVVIAHVEGQDVVVEQAEGVNALHVRLSDALLDLDQPVRVVRGDTLLFEGVAARTVGALAATLNEREDPALLYPAEVVVRW